MAARRVVISLTIAEARALAALAECAGNSYEDALGVLDNAARVQAGYRGIDAIRAALIKAEG